MPELPEVETMCRGVRPVVGSTIARVIDPKCVYRPVECQPSIRAIQQRLRGQILTDVCRIGKRVVLQTQRWALVFQPKMTGLVALEEPPGNEHVRLILELVSNLGRHHRLTFWDRRGLGTIQLLERSELHDRLVAGRLGPDALAITLDDFQNRVSSTRRSIKVALLDQKLVAGIGNLYASEMLHAAGIDPRRVSGSLDPIEFERLYEQMRRILLTAIEHEGSTLSDGTYRTALNQSGTYQNSHRVYDRAGSLCSRCGQSEIVRIVQAQRSTFFCARCQH